MAELRFECSAHSRAGQGWRYCATCHWGLLVSLTVPGLNPGKSVGGACRDTGWEGGDSVVSLQGILLIRDGVSLESTKEKTTEVSLEQAQPPSTGWDSAQGTGSGAAGARLRGFTTWFCH